MSAFIPQVIDAVNRCYNRAIMLKVHYGCISHYRKMLEINHIPNRPVTGEKEYVKKWRRLYPLVAVEDYRLFSRYIEVTPDLVPEAISHNIVEALLVPPEFRAYYSDKNMFDRIMPAGFLPKTILRRISGSFFSADYRLLDEADGLGLEQRLEAFDRIVVKPTVDSCSGQRVTLFARRDGTWFGLNGVWKDRELSLSRLKEFFGNDFIVQECLKQSAYMSRLCPTSVNTIRLFVYRSVRSEEVVIPSVIMRLGHTGSFVDNSHAGGVSIGVLPGGRLNTYTTDQYGRKITEVNGIDFSREELIIPHFNRVLEFAKTVGRHLIHCRMSNIDIMIDETGTPKLVEYNLSGMSTWLYQFNSGLAYGAYCDEIIDYCAKRLSEAGHVRIDY